MLSHASGEAPVQVLARTVAEDLRSASALVAAGKLRTGTIGARLLAADFDPVLEFRSRSRRQSSSDEVDVMHSSAPSGSPVPQARVSSVFGDRFHPIDKVWKQHRGIDLAAPTGTPVLSTAPGRVTFAGSRRGYGMTIEIQHPSGHSTLYAHLSEIDVEAGDEILRGHAIGKVGATGRVTGPHLHYEVRQGAKPENPATYMAARR